MPTLPLLQKILHDNPHPPVKSSHYVNPSPIFALKDLSQQIKPGEQQAKNNMVIELSPHSLHSRNLYMLIANGQRVDLPRSAC